MENYKGISIIIPTYNRADFIGDAITSVLSQDYSGYLEILISDDGSTDDTIEIAKTFGENVKILLKPKTCSDQGAAAARNRGIKAATQEYLCFLDSDDYFLPGHLIKMVRVLESNINFSYVFCRSLETTEENNVKYFKQWTRAQIKKNDIKNLVVSGHYVVCTNVFLFKKEIFKKVGGFNENYKNAEDIDMWMRISEIFTGEFSDHLGAVRRTHGINQLTANNKSAILKFQYNVFKDALRRYFELGLSDRYRLLKLLILTTKYKLGSLGMFHILYKIQAYKRNKRGFNVKDWFSLSHFLENS